MVRTQLSFSKYDSEAIFTRCVECLFQKYCRTMSDEEGNMSLAGEGRIKHFKAERKIIIYSR